VGAGQDCRAQVFRGSRGNRTGADAQAALNTICQAQVLDTSSDWTSRSLDRTSAFFCIWENRSVAHHLQPDVHSPHIDRQIADHREIAQRFDADGPAIASNFTDGRAPGKCFYAIDLQPTSAAGGMMAGMAVDKRTIMKRPNPFDAIQHVFIGVNLYLKFVEKRSPPAFLAINLVGYIPIFCHSDS
jgi:hypothetical protein